MGDDAWQMLTGVWRSQRHAAADAVPKTILALSCGESAWAGHVASQKELHFHSLTGGVAV